MITRTTTARPRPTAATAPLNPVPAAAAAPPTVLVSERDPVLAAEVARGLAAAGLDAHTAADGLAALDVLDRVQPVLVLLDLDLPVISGFRLMQVLRHRPARPIVLVLTSLSFQEAKEALCLGADDFLMKPYLPEEAVTRVQRLLVRTASQPDSPTEARWASHHR